MNEKIIEILLAMQKDIKDIKQDIVTIDTRIINLEGQINTLSGEVVEIRNAAHELKKDAKNIIGHCENLETDMKSIFQIQDRVIDQISGDIIRLRAKLS